MLADDPFRVDLRGDSARTVPTRLFWGSQPGLMIAAPGPVFPLRRFSGAPLNIRAAFWYGVEGREMPL